MGKGKRHQNRSNKKAKPANTPTTANSTTTNISNSSSAAASSEQRSTSTPGTKPVGIDQEGLNQKPHKRTRKCHFVPQWILRNFARQEGPQDPKNPSVYYFDIQKKELTRSLTRDVYYEDYLFSAHQNEEKLSQLESRASRSFQEIMATINNRDKNPGNGSAPKAIFVTQKRKYLEDLRKFLFVMYYHQVSVGHTFYDEDHPENDRMQSWIQSYRERYKLSTSPQDTWLHVLSHYLRTPHKELMEQGGKVERFMTNEIFSRLRPDISSSGSNMMRDALAVYKSVKADPELEEWRSLPYYDNMQMFLVIWEAAPDEEFLMSDNSFGLYEGRNEEVGPLHRIYIISPKIALVLCHPGLKETSHLPGFVNYANPFQLSTEQCSMSMLLDAPHPAANVKYKHNKPLPSSMITLYGNAGAAHPHPDDEFELRVSILSSKDTHTINAIILGNVRDAGKITFGSKGAALRTLREFETNLEFNRKCKPKFAPLVKQLSEELGARSDTHPIPHPDPSDTTPLLQLPPLSEEPGTFWETSLMVYHVLHTGQGPQCTSYRLWEQLHTDYLATNANTSSNVHKARLVSKMDDRFAYVLFKFCSGVLARQFGESLNFQPYLEQLIIRFLDHLLKNNRPIFDMIEESAVEILRRSCHQPTLALTARVKIEINPGDDDSIPVPTVPPAPPKNSESTANRADGLEAPAAAYLEWSFGRTEHIRRNMSPEVFVPPYPYTVGSPQELPDLGGKSLADTVPNNQDPEPAENPDHESNTKDSLPTQQVDHDTTNNLSPEEGIGEEGSTQCPDVDLGASFNTELQEEVEQEFNRSRTWKDHCLDFSIGVCEELGVIREELELILVKALALTVVLPAIYSLYVFTATIVQAVQLAYHYQPSSLKPGALPATQTSKPRRGTHSPDSYSATTIIISSIVIYLATIIVVLYAFFSLTLVEFSALAIFNLLNDIDGDFTATFADWYAHVWSGKPKDPKESRMFLEVEVFFTIFLLRQLGFL